MNLKESIRRILRESEILKKVENDDLSPHLKRRLHELPKYIRSTANWLNPSAFYSFDEFLERIAFSSSRDFVAENSQGMDYDEYDNNCRKIEKIIMDLIMKKFYDEIYNYYKGR